jgi:sugar phosphate isomerase/epimerase
LSGRRGVPELGLAHLSVVDAGPIELLDAAEAAAFDSVNMHLVAPPVTSLYVLKPHSRSVIGDAALIREIKLRVARTGVRVFEASCGWVGTDFDPKAMPRIFDTLAEIGTKRVAVVGWDPDRSRLIANLATLCAAAEGYGMRAILEFMPYSAVRDVADAAAVLAAVARPNLDLMIDALHLVRSGGTPADLRVLDPERIAAVQLCDGPARGPAPEKLRDESVNRRRFPGDGDFPLFDLMDALPKNIVVEVEVPSAEHAGDSIEARARLCAERGRAFLAAYRERQPA